MSKSSEETSCPISRARLDERGLSAKLFTRAHKAVHSIICFFFLPYFYLQNVLIVEVRLSLIRCCNALWLFVFCFLLLSVSDHFCFSVLEKGHCGNGKDNASIARHAE